MATPHVTVRKHTPRRRRGMGSPRDGGAMQHAHRAYQPARPCGSRYLQHKWDKSDFERHRDKVKSAKATISTSPPRKYGHLEVKLKKLKLEEERVSKIQRDNHALLEKISRIMRTTGRVDHRNDYSSRSLCSEKRHRELLQVTRENRALLERLSRCGSRYSVARWHEDWLRSNGYGDIIARYPRGALPEKHFQASCGSSAGGLRRHATGPFKGSTPRSSCVGSHSGHGLHALQVRRHVLPGARVRGPGHVLHGGREREELPLNPRVAARELVRGNRGWEADLPQSALSQLAWARAGRVQRAQRGREPRP
ncbi:uncharacterized protein cfap97d2 isoform X2 [Scleropages formosus]|uniref:uncharacterized protein cfap97d2 isoform X2 n=1 Tax=Scleropages formosus TaxID=113540 RepID=UPI0010FACD54|nr:uncharacterized protein LOC108928389 isoform X2 [Scleropages formosus]